MMPSKEERSDVKPVVLVVDDDPFMRKASAILSDPSICRLKCSLRRRKFWR